ncbi:hypothetical protein A3726_26605 [Erythrobacter sp. HI0037]|nr:hypothetical protein A3726_26605 [Erythrobacter sp. HI0037]
MSDDTNIEKAIEQVNGVLAGNPRAPHVKAFFHEPTFTATYVVSDDQTKRAAIIDSVWDFDQPSGRTSLEAADEIIDYVREAGLTVDWILETHAQPITCRPRPICRRSWAAKWPSAATS